MTMALHVLGPVLMTELLLPALADDCGRVVFVTSGGMYTQALPVHDPEFRHGRVQRHRRLRPQQAGAGRAAAGARRHGGRHPVSSVHATHPGWASTPGLDASLPRFATALRPVLRSDAAGTDTTTWLLATEPAPASGLLWHDRRARPTSVVRRTRPRTRAGVTFWQWVARPPGSTA